MNRRFKATDLSVLIGVHRRPNLGSPLLALGIVAALAANAVGQTPARPAFEVASVKLAPPGAYGTDIETDPGGRVSLHNMALRDMIVVAWGIEPFQILGGPPWIDSVRYDVTAKPAALPKRGEIPLMIQSFLVERFQLAIHHETQTLPIYSLVLARKDGKLGPGLAEAKEGSCTKFDPVNPPSPPETGAAPRRWCGNSSVNPSHLTAIGVPIANLIPLFSQVLERTIVDKTGLTGSFDVGMAWTPDETQAMKWQMPPGVPAPAPPDPGGPSIFTAIQEQLGLKLESSKGPVDVVIVDRAEKPSEN